MVDSITEFRLTLLGRAIIAPHSMVGLYSARCVLAAAVKGTIQ